ncbi:hypothetical protein C453_12591 [Haloferax elongans ATCC BAA-1513]|uniref:DUF7998 domain-containing protein n=1 Tax=Haloferax elongans ATCC BAA-1513 TaxID=1230453 RepID=M0HJW9_HALEO|nr:hypothetical protein [Haloferax elongans]ELZ84855.1 hypothetical protein C453_12591 [Haloferax elongans ATCC BAA-1513]
MFGLGSPTPDDVFEDEDSFDPATIPTPGAFLADHHVLAGSDHLSVHQTAHDLFEERGVYDVTFGYNLTRLNLDTRHPDAGFRYAVDADDSAVLWAEFTPTTPFCPQSQTLAVGASRAWNELAESHNFDLVRVRVAEMHERSEAVNDRLVDVESEYVP